jgi:hypothetical protein
MYRSSAKDAYEGTSPADLVRKFPYILVATTAWDYNTLQAHRHMIGDASYHVSQIKGNMILKALEGYIKELGYTALRGVAIPQAAGVASGGGRTRTKRSHHQQAFRRARPHA